MKMEPHHWLRLRRLFYVLGVAVFGSLLVLLGLHIDNILLARVGFCILAVAVLAGNIGVIYSIAMTIREWIDGAIQRKRR